jgi:hypothetical protein
MPRLALDAANQARFQQLLKDLLTDDAVRTAFLNNPTAVFQQRNIALPPGVTIHAIADRVTVDAAGRQQATINIVLPLKRNAHELTDDYLAGVAKTLLGGCDGGG